MVQHPSRRGRLARSMAALAVAALMSQISSSVRAADKGWTCGSAPWSNVSCWSLGSLPAAEDAVFLTSVDGASRTVTLDVSLPPPTTLNGFLGSLSVDAMGGGSMTFRLSGGVDFSAGFQYVGVIGNATFEHLSGRNDVRTSPGGIIYDVTDIVQGALYVGLQSTSSASYQLSGSGELSSIATTIGYRGNGSFVQSGGVHATSEGMKLGFATGSVGSYLLTDGALANANGIQVGHDGVGTFVQSGGRHSVQNGSLGVGDPSGASSYVLQGGELRASTTGIGNGVFIQTGGSHEASGVVIASAAVNSSEYRMQGGSLTVVGGIRVGLSGGGSFQHSAGDVVANLLSLAEFDRDDDGSYTLSGSASLSTQGEGIGIVGHGVFNQSGGVNNATHSLVLGTHPESSGTYNLSAGSLNVRRDSVGPGETATSVMRVGEAGIGVVNQSGGAVVVDGPRSIDGILSVGRGSGSGSYNLGPGATLFANYLVIGDHIGVIAGSGRFVQTGGSVTVRRNLDVGSYLGAVGEYTLTDGAL